MANQYRTITPKGIDSIFRTLSEADPRIAEYRLGDLARGDGKSDEDYPLVLMELVGCDLVDRGVMNYNRWQVKLYCFTMRRSDWLNTTDAFSQCQVILGDMVLRFKKEQQFRDWGFLYDKGTVKFDYVLRDDRDDVIGVSVDIVFDTPVMICLDEVPGDVLPDQGLFYSASTITTTPVYLTCNTLTGCTVIQSIQADIDTLYTLTGGTGVVSGAYLPLSGGTVSGDVTINSVLYVSKTTGGGDAIDANATTPNGRAGHFVSLNAEGVFAESTNDDGVHGQSDNGYGVHGSSVNSSGVYATAEGVQPVILGRSLDPTFTASLLRVEDQNGTGFTVSNNGGLYWDSAAAVNNTRYNLRVPSIIPGTNISTGGTEYAPVISVISSPTFTAVNATTILSGGTDLSTFFDIDLSRTIKKNITQAGHGLSVGDVIYIDAADTYQRAGILSSNPDQADKVVGMVDDVPDGDTFSLVTEGYVRVPGAAFISGKMHYLSNSNYGLQDTVPNTDLSEIVKPIAVALNTETLYLLNGTKSSTYLGWLLDNQTTSEGVRNEIGLGTANNVQFLSVTSSNFISGATNLNSVFAPISVQNQWVQPGTNITTGGTPNAPVINVVSTPSFTSVQATSISATTYFSGSTPLGSLLGGGAATYVQPGTNISTGGTPSAPIVSVVGSPTFTAVTASNFISGSTNLSDLFAPHYDPVVLAYTGGSQVTSSTSYADVHSTANFTISSPGTYEVWVRATYNAAATTTGIGLSFSGPTASRWFVILNADVLSTDRSSIAQIQSDWGVVATSSRGTSDNHAIINGRITFTSTGTLALRYRSEIAGSNITITAVQGELQRIH